MMKRIESGDFVDQALEALQLEEAPQSLLPGVLSRIQALPRQRPIATRQAMTMPRFGLSWLDVALSLFFAMMIALVGMLSFTLPAPIVDYLRLEGQYYWQYLQLEPWLLAPAFAALLVMMGQALVFLWAMRRPRETRGA